MNAVVQLAGETDFDGWRAAARDLRGRGVAPETVHWTAGPDLFTPAPARCAAASPGRFSVPRGFLELASAAICHRSTDRFALLYRLLWRLEREPGLMALVTDPDVAEARDMANAVSRAAHKMKAFVRFRLLTDVEPETYVAWFEPAHHVVRRTAPFFRDRFANMRFSILTPDACVHWDGAEVIFGPGASPADAPAGDSLEDHWRVYYASIFNPARLKVRAMQSEMPKRYWRNLPEASLIPGLIEQANERTAAMVAAEPAVAKKRAPKVAAAQESPEPAPAGSLAQIAADIQSCRRCDLWRDTTQAVPGEGPNAASIMLVGEQPGDMDDLAGRPFVGPAGQMLDRALLEAGVARDRLYVTNAVKHFKHEPRGKRRLHKTPVAGEVSACRWWLDQERARVAPKVVVALGATAALALLGRAVPILASRGRPFELADGAACLVTMHPSFLLRLPDEPAKAEAFGRLVDDLRQAAQLAMGAGTPARQEN